MQRFDLTRSPFAILGVTIRSTQSQIVEAHDDRLFDGGEDESALSSSLSGLTVARDRLEHEICWLPELAPKRASDIVSRLPLVKSRSEADRLIGDAANLSRVNIIADMLDRRIDTPHMRMAIVRGYGELDLASAREAVERARSASGFGGIADEAWTRAVDHLLERHSKCLGEAITSDSEGPNALAELVELHLSEAMDTPKARLLDLVIDHYDRWSEPLLDRLEDQIDGCINRLRENPRSVLEIGEIEGLLDEWDRISQPVQLRDETKGLDEPKSKRLFRKLRDLAIWLTNEQAEHEAAREIAAALHQTFPELPSVLAQVTEDIRALDQIIEESRAIEIARPLADAANAAEASLSVFGRQVANGQFRAGGSGLAGQLFEAFDSVCAASGALSDPSLPWLIVRSVALALNNTGQSPDAAKVILTVAEATAPADVRRRLEDDLRILGLNLIQRDLENALRSGDLNRARDLATTLAETSPRERSEALAIKAELDQRIQTRTLKRLGWALAAAVVLWMILQDNMSNRTYSPPDYNVGTDSDMSYDTNMGLDTPDRDAEPPPDSGDPLDQQEEPPAPYSGGTLTRTQLRYCRFERERIEYLRQGLSPRMRERFNARVEDFNSRCTGVSSYQSDRSAIDQELVLARNNLSQQATATLQEWQVAERPLETEPGTTGSSSGDQGNTGSFENDAPFDDALSNLGQGSRND